MTLTDCIKADREVGTSGPWRVMMRYSHISHKHTPQVVWDVPNSTALDTICDTGGCFQSDSANARRIARLPDLEDAYLAQADQIAALEVETARLRKLAMNVATEHLASYERALAESVAMSHRVAQGLGGFVLREGKSCHAKSL